MPMMRRAAILYNPSAGSQRHKRLAIVEAAAGILRERGIEASLIPTSERGSAGGQAAEAIRAGHDTIFAAGGDGTLHEVLQGVMTDEQTRAATLGVLPLGTGNVLANDLKLPRDPLAALRAQLEFAPRRIAVGRLEFATHTGVASRYCIVTCGIGWDAVMLYRANAEKKGKWGQAAYVIEGLKLALQWDLPLFPVEWVDPSGERHSSAVTQALAVRVTDFGGFMRRFAPGAALVRDDFQIVLFRTPNTLRHAWYMIGALLGKSWPVKGIDRVHATEIVCRPPERPHPKAHFLSVEADGEYLGKLPVRLSIVREGVNLLMPKTGVTSG
ncbi:MAG: hypothetical protein HYX26_01865 [Acidobacteriales bacterium]|nr:hypothetical protein [Terriglobales bacterium]